MFVHISEQLESNLNDEMIGLISKYIGEEPNATQVAQRIIISSLLGLIINKGSDEEGAAQLIGWIDSDNFNESMLPNLKSLMGDPQRIQGLIRTGRSIISSISGKQEDYFMLSLIGRSGLSPSGGSSLIPMLATLLMHAIGQNVREADLDTQTLMFLLSNQKEFTNSRKSSGMSGGKSFIQKDELGANRGSKE